MAASSRRQIVLLSVLGVVLVGVLYYDLAPGDPTPPSRPPRVPQARTAPGSSIAVDPVRLDVLKRTRPEPGEGERDPFTFEPRRPAKPPTVTQGTGPTIPVGPSAPVVPPGPPPPPPITLRFIGILNAASTSKIAVLSDGKNVFYGREGETIDGRYRIDRIGIESIEMAWTDGRGHQIIRLSGS